MLSGCQKRTEILLVSLEVYVQLAHGDQSGLRIYKKNLSLKMRLWRPYIDSGECDNGGNEPAVRD